MLTWEHSAILLTCISLINLNTRVNSQISLSGVQEKPVLSGLSKLDKTNVLNTDGSIMQVKSIAECSLGSILQYFWPALSNNPSLKPTFGLLLSDCLTLNAPIATKVICFSCLLKCLRSFYGRQCGPRLDCSYTVLGPRYLLLYLVRQ